MNHLSERCLDDFAVGQTFGSGRPRIDEDRALAFAAELDPHLFHLEDAAGALLDFRWTDRQRLALVNAHGSG
jgi:acyl dehydratase